MISYFNGLYPEFKKAHDRAVLASVLHNDVMGQKAQQKMKEIIRSQLL